MDLWIILTPVLKTLFYITSLLALGTVIFVRHFQQFQTAENTLFCTDLITRACRYGMVISAGLLFSVAGNLGGEVWSIFDPTIFSIAIYSKSGNAAGLAFFGFALIVIARRYEFNPVPLFIWVGVLLLLISFVWTGHAQKSGLIAQVALSLHLVAIAFWLGSFFPLRRMCSALESENLYKIADRFGTLAIFYVCLLLISGLIFAYILIGDLSLLLSTVYGNVFLMKITLVSLLLGLGALNKFRLVPLVKLEPAIGAQKLQKSIQIEMLIALLILSFSGFLTTSTTLPMGG
jgi:putative copper resistance protein D